MNKIKTLACVALFTFTTAWAGDTTESGPQRFLSASQTEVVTAEVEAINLETRQLTVRNADGESLTFTVGEEARNLPQVSVGDVIAVEVRETITVDVMAAEGATPDAAAVMVAARAEEGEMPGFAAAGATVFTATVEDINIEANTFKLKGPDGVVDEYVALNPANLKRAKVGDLVVFTITESVAISVERPDAE